MKTVFALLAFALTLCFATANAQTLALKKLNGQTFITSSGTQKVPTITNEGSVADTLQISATRTYIRIRNSGVEQARFIYGVSNDSLNGYTALNFCRLLNQGYFRTANYLGAYKYSQLVTTDTSTTGNYYYDTDSVSFRVKRASGGFITLQTKN
jgi:hypothetical protein